MSPQVRNSLNIALGLQLRVVPSEEWGQLVEVVDLDNDNKVVHRCRLHTYTQAPDGSFQLSFALLTVRPPPGWEPPDIDLRLRIAEDPTYEQIIEVAAMGKPQDFFRLKVDTFGDPNGRFFSFVGYQPRNEGAP